MFRDVAVLESVSMIGRYPSAVWSIPKPEDPVLVHVPGRDLTAAELQDGAVIKHVAIARHGTGEVTIVSGLWSTEVTLHALGRAIQRAPRTDLDELLLELHRGLLTASVDFV